MVIDVDTAQTQVPSQVEPAAQKTAASRGAVAPQHALPKVVPLTNKVPASMTDNGLATSAINQVEDNSVVPEVFAANTTRQSNVSSLPSKQMDMLKDLANLSLSYADPVGPGKVTGAQQGVLDAWTKNAGSAYSQYMASNGLSAIAQDPDSFFKNESLAMQSSWSNKDASIAMGWMGLSAKDWDQYEKLKAAEEKRHSGFLLGAVEFVAGALITYFSAGTLSEFGVGLMASGVGSMAGNS